MTEFVASDRIYVDTNIWIYYIEGNQDFWQKVDALFEQIESAGATLVTSEISVAECLIRPARQSNTATIELYERFFEEGNVEMIGLDGALAYRAALAGGPLGLKVIDAIHYLSAREAGCGYFLTGDGRFRSSESMTILGLERL